MKDWMVAIQAGGKTRFVGVSAETPGAAMNAAAAQSLRGKLERLQVAADGSATAMLVPDETPKRQRVQLRAIEQVRLFNPASSSGRYIAVTLRHEETKRGLVAFYADRTGIYAAQLLGGYISPNDDGPMLVLLEAIAENCGTSWRVNETPAQRIERLRSLAGSHVVHLAHSFLINAEEWDDLALRIRGASHTFWIGETA